MDADDPPEKIETLDEALAIANDDDAAVTEEEKETETTEEVGTVLGDFA